jgi:hypothetical protein
MRSNEGRKIMVKIPYKHQLTAKTLKPPYHKALWHNCKTCHIHFMSEQPHLTAYLCDECFNSMPHYREVKKQQQVKKGPTYAWLDTNWPIEYILLYILGCSLCLLTIGYYLWFK